MEKLHNRGGARPGAGRKSNHSQGLTKRKNVAITLDPETLQALDEWAAAQKISRSEGIQRVLADFLAPFNPL